MSQDQDSDNIRPPFVFPRWANYLMPSVLFMVLCGAVLTPLVLGLGAVPETLAVGYAPVQPVPFSHALHAGTLQMDCRYCHSTVMTSNYAAIPSTQVCMNCHASIKADSDRLKPIRESYAKGTPVTWIKVHDLPGYAYFSHAAHVNQGVGCASCHGRIDQMEVVRQTKPLSMSWCLGCHREPERNLRPRDQITNMQWDAQTATGKSQLELGTELRKAYGIQGPDYMTSCSTCHR
jgi:hypothetical protein